MHYLSTSAPCDNNSAPFHLSYLLAPTSLIPPLTKGAVPPTLGTTGIVYDKVYLCVFSLLPPSGVMAPVLYHGHHTLSMLKRPSRIEQLQVDWKRLGT